MAGREGLSGGGPGPLSRAAAPAAAGVPGSAAPHLVLQVQPDACAQVVDAAFTALREMVLRSDADDAPRRLAELNAAHRAMREAQAGPPSAPGAGRAGSA